ncbi:glycoside hydrolase superfamily [Pyrenochaeta sp. MPI-SDFR-AT-0127]|nr:glycoside hydrolase superfamily [Pyrenochaeta sp. MPI-SDFR-AT-0127]
MSSSTFSRAALAAGILASTASAAYNPASTQNVAVYWGQGSDQIPLSQVCSDPSVDIVNIGFVNGFPKNVGDYPETNHANACWGYYPDPKDSTKDSKLLKNCAGVEQAIIDCQTAGKKVLLSLGGGAPTNYYLPNQAVAEYFAEFLVGAFGPLTSEWSAAGKPRPFGAAAVDGYDLDLEAEVANVPSKEFIFKNYDHFVTRARAKQPNILISAAPQCVIPDARLADVISKVSFDMIFTQFYNTYECSALLGFKDLNSPTTGFSFDAWITWLRNNSVNRNAKLYLGLPAGPDGVKSHPDHYLKPEQANALIVKYQKKHPTQFGGVMLWEATVSVRNPTYGQSYGYWMKAALDGTFTSKYKPAVSSSSRPVSSTRVSSTRVTSSTRVPSSSVRLSSSVRSSSVHVSSSVRSSSVHVTSSVRPSSVHVSSSVRPSSSNLPGSSSVHVPSSRSTPVQSSSVYVPQSSSVYVPQSSSVYVPQSSSVYVPQSSSVYVPQSSSVYVPQSSSVYVPQSSSVYVPQSSSVYVPQSSSVYVPQSSSIYVPQSSSIYVPQSSSVYVPQSSSVYVPHPSESSSVYVPHPSESSSVYVPSPSDSVSIVYPADTTKNVYPSASSTPGYPSDIYSTLYPVYNASSTHGVYPTDYPTYPESTPNAASSSKGYPAESSKGGDYPAYPAESSKGGDYPAYPAESSKGGDYPAYPVESSKGHDSYPSVTKKPDYPAENPSYPTGTTTVITTTYVDVCPTGLTTITTTIVKTVCGSCAKPTKEPEYPEGWTTSVYVDKTITVTITKPIHPATDVPAYPTSKPDVYPADYPASPKPSSPTYPEADKPVYGADKPSEPEYPVEDEKVTSTKVQYITLTKVPVPYTPVPHAPVPHVSSAPYAAVPYGAKNGTSAYVPKPTGTGKPTKPSSYSPPEFEGAASRFGVGLTAVVGVVAAFFVL